MSTKKTKPTGPRIASEEDLSAAANRYVELTIELTAKKAEHDKRIAAMNTAFGLLNVDLAREIEGLATSLQLYAESRLDLFPASADDGPRSRTYQNAVIGFRTNPPKVEKRLSKDTFEAIVERLEGLSWGEKYVVYARPVLNKEELLKDRGILTEAQLAAAGLKFEQGQTFFVTPHFETAEPVRKAA